MEYYCEVCGIYIKPESKYKHLKSNTHKDFDKCKHMKLAIENPNINNIDRAFYEYNIQHSINFDFYFVKCEYKLVFNDNRYYCPYVTSILSDNKTLISWSSFSKEVISDFKDKGFNFKRTAEMKIITISNERDMSYGFYIKHNNHAVEWELNAMINKTKN